MPTQKTDKSSNALSFEGTGAGAQATFAPLDSGQKLKASDFDVIV